VNPQALPPGWDDWTATRVTRHALAVLAVAWLVTSGMAGVDHWWPIIGCAVVTCPLLLFAMLADAVRLNRARRRALLEALG
jgi:hypothetical protein